MSHSPVLLDGITIQQGRQKIFTDRAKIRLGKKEVKMVNEINDLKELLAKKKKMDKYNNVRVNEIDTRELLQDTRVEIEVVLDHLDILNHYQ